MGIREGSMERPVFQPPGTPVMDLDTPALVVDLDVMDRNIETFHIRFNQSGAKIRPHVTGHQTPKIAHRQLQAGNTVGGISVTSVGEAEVFSNAGITDILVASQIVTRPKIRRLCALAGSNRIGVAVDNPQNVSDLSQAATAQGVTLGVLVELDVGLGRCGVAPGDEALDLARSVSGSLCCDLRQHDLAGNRRRNINENTRSVRDRPPYRWGTHKLQERRRTAESRRSH